MKCHYDVLAIPRDADESEIKKAYKRAAIKWHPDKNLDNTVEATEQFQLVQQAFDVLSDPHERKWYDDHREAILKGKSGGQFDEECLDVYQFFTATCYKGFGNDSKGFYSVYEEVFKKIAAEDSEYCTNEDSDFEIPSFGKSGSPYEEVHAFYAYWQSYSTKKSYSWLDPHDVREAPNRRVARLIEKENKKVRDKARKARNEEIRELVGFVRKRDKRVQAHAKRLQDIAAEKAKKVEERRRNRIKERNDEMASYKESEWSKFSNVEKELKDIEASLAAEFGESDDNSSNEDMKSDSLYCIACNKLFKTPKAFQNHESSKKHKENVQLIQETVVTNEDEAEEETDDYNEEEITAEENDSFIDNLLKNGDTVVTDDILGDSEDDICLNENQEHDNSTDMVEEVDSFDSKNEDSESSEFLESPNECADNSEMSSDTEVKLEKIVKKQRGKKVWNEDFEEVTESDVEFAILGQSKKQRKKQMQKNILKEKIICEKLEENGKNKEKSNDINSTDITCILGDNVNEIRPTQSSDNSDIEDNALEQKNTAGKRENFKKKPDLTCQVCKSFFPSKNKLFQHLGKTGHAVIIPSKIDNGNLEAKKCRNKKRTKK